jgi:hypothetical protein
MSYALVKLLAIESGLFVTLLLGCFSSAFLRRSVTVPFPDEFADFKHAEKDGGGTQLGTLERVMFFASFSFEGYALVAGWLAFKAAAKWAAWQHIVKIPDKATDANEVLSLKIKLSSRLLGRFLNGTLYNVFCGAVGLTISTAIFWGASYVPSNIVPYAAGILPILIIMFLVFEVWKLFAKCPEKPAKR